MAWPGKQNFSAPALTYALRSHPKEGVLYSHPYRAVVRGLACRRCGKPPRSQFCHTDEGKGQSIKTDDRRGWAGCADCHYLVGTSGQFVKNVRRALDAQYALETRAEVLRLGLWPQSLPLYEKIIP